MKAPIARLAYLIAFLVVAGYAFVTLRGPGGIHAVSEKNVLIRAQEKTNEQLAREIERTRQHIKRLNGDPDQQELEIQNQYNLVHPGDKVYFTGDPKKQ